MIEAKGSLKLTPDSKRNLLYISSESVILFSQLIALKLNPHKIGYHYTSL